MMTEYCTLQCMTGLGSLESLKLALAFAGMPTELRDFQDGEIVRGICSSALIIGMHSISTSLRLPDGVTYHTPV